jgi:hypothetical protein
MSCQLTAYMVCCLHTSQHCMISIDGPMQCDGMLTTVCVFLQYVREQQAARQQQQRQSHHELQQPEPSQKRAERADAECLTVAAAVHEEPVRTVHQMPHHEAGRATPAAAAAPAKPAATASLQPQLLLSNLMQTGDAALQSELQVGLRVISVLLRRAIPCIACDSSASTGRASCQNEVLTVALLDLGVLRDA